MNDSQNRSIFMTVNLTFPGIITGNCCIVTVIPNGQSGIKKIRSDTPVHFQYGILVILVDQLLDQVLPYMY